MSQTLQTLHGRCLRCGRPDDGERAHCPCGASLLVDVVLHPPCPPERERFQLARALALLGAPVPPFTELRKDLAREDGRVVRGVSQVFARQVVEVLAKEGSAARLCPTLLPKTRTEGRPRVLAGLVVALCVMGVGMSVILRRPSPPPPVGSSEMPPTSLAPPAPVVEPPKPQALTTQEISQRALPGTVSLSCESSTGSGFFVSEEVVLTNAHVACPLGKVMEVTLEDGRRVLGQTLERDELLDLATVQVLGGRARPLPLGDATLLSPGDKLVFIGSPKGLSFTVHEGKVSHLGRQYLGVGYVQFDASVNPGNSGGPLLNERGEVVGIVSLKVMNAEGIGLALPIQYAGKHATLPEDLDSARRWTTLLQKVAREEELELRRFRLEPHTPALLAVGEDEHVGPVVMLMERFPQGALPTTHRFQLQAGTETCELKIEFTRWLPIEQAAEGADESRRLRWLKARGITEALYVSAERLPVEFCSIPGQGEGQLSVREGSPELSRAKLDLSRLARAQEWWWARRSNVRSLTNSAPPAPREERVDRHIIYDGRLPQFPTPQEFWSSSFQDSRDSLSRLEAQRRKYAQDDARGELSARDRLRDIDQKLKEEREHMDDLERRASQEGIPREWR